MKLGLDISSIGYFVLVDDNRIIDICKVPTKTDTYKSEIRKLKKGIEFLKPDLKTRGMKQKTRDKITALKKTISTLEDQDPKNIKLVKDWILKYIKDIEYCVIEGLIYQTNDASSIKSFMKMSEYFGICTTILSDLNISYKVISIKDWRSYYNYNKLSIDEIKEIQIKYPNKSRSAIRKEFTKKESIRISEEKIVNIGDWHIPKGCRNKNDNICESALLAYIGDKINE